MSDRVEEFLEHHGVLGMKWGVRKNRGRVKKVGAKKYPKGTHPDHRTAHNLNRKPVHQLSNNNIKSVNARLEMEKKMAQLRREKSPSAKGKAYVAAAIGIAGTATTIYNLYNSKAGQEAIKTGMQWVHRAKYAAGITKAIAR